MHRVPSALRAGSSVLMRTTGTLPCPQQGHHQVVAPAPYSTDKRPSFFGSLLKNIKDEYTKSQEMQESLKKFREDAQKLEESEALKEVKDFFFTFT